MMSYSIGLEKHDDYWYLLLNGEKYFKCNLKDDYMVCRKYKVGEPIRLTTRALDLINAKNRYLVIEYGDDTYAINIDKITLSESDTTELNINKFKKIKIVDKNKSV